MSKRNVLLWKNHPNGTKTWGPYEYDSKNYYLIQNPEKGIAICDENGKLISEWFDDVLEYVGLFQGESEYFVAKKNGKEAIFRADGKGVSRVSNWFENVLFYGLVEGKSPYYVAYSKTKKEEKVVAIYHVSGKRLTQWYRIKALLVKQSFLEGEKAPCFLWGNDYDVVLVLNQTKEKVLEAVKVLKKGPHQSKFFDFTNHFKKRFSVTALKNDLIAVEHLQKEKCYLIRPPVEVTLSSKIEKPIDVVNALEKTLEKESILKTQNLDELLKLTKDLTEENSTKKPKVRLTI